jgi:DNA invertase Pin-like site-specific DNA recombinase
MSKVTAEHLGRSAIVYVRQSTPYQVANNLESQRRQYGLVERGRLLGWSDVQVIDDDLGRSGSGIARPGFEKLLAAICEGRVGAVLSIEASRLARNGRDWHTLLEFCGLVDTLIVDEDGIYNPRQPNDRLLLGMKGTMSEMELSVFRQRSIEAIKQKAQRGELFRTVAIGYLKTDDDRIEKDPNRRVQDAIALVFHKFGEQSFGQLGSAMSTPLERSTCVPAFCHHSTCTPMVSRTALSISCRSSLSGLRAARVRVSKLKRKGCSMMSAAGSRLEIWLMTAAPISIAPDCTAPTTCSSL